MTAVHIVALGGGSGTRFWPVSRRSRPKQLLALDGKRTLLAATFERVESIAPVSSFWMVVGDEYAELCREAVPEIPAAQVLTEPQGRNTAPAIALAALHVKRKAEDAIMVVLPADHAVRDPKAFCAALKIAVKLAELGPIVTLGIEPTFAETGYGYIERGAADPKAEHAFAVKRFVEKPDPICAQAFLARGGFSWNAGIFVMRPSAYLAEVQRQLPELHAALQPVAAAIGTPAYNDALATAYESLTPVSIDKGVMEHAAEVAVVPVECGWSDVGSWNALKAVSDPDHAGNVIHGNAVVVDSNDCVVYSGDDQLVAVLGLEGVAVVHTPDATLVVPKKRAQEVREIIARIERQGWQRYL
ncbi:MAG: mannose-1-phosphate guanylyltransferase [Deltaproteobacteria bacterium]|nr:mannose-1-phosphate guanylyltransferase [Deltaproteobacteria bacterium]